jgi:DNA polymerase-3 subunit beta
VTSSPNSRAAAARLLTIGEVARASGLAASTLRFYDREGVLVPADVDAGTGYRRYASTQVRAARLVASLRRVGMPLAEVSVVLEQDARGAVDAARDVVAAHEQRLVDGLRDARREIARTLALLREGGREVVAASVRAADLGAAVAAVRFAVAPGEPAAAASRDGSEHDLRVLTGVLVELSAGSLRLVTTDRYRMAVAVAPRVDAGALGSGPEASATPLASTNVPVRWVDGVAALCAREPDAVVRLELVDEVVRASVAGDWPAARPVEATAVAGTYPDHRAVLDGPAGLDGGVAHSAEGLLAVLPLGAERVGLAVHLDRVRVAADTDADVFVDPEFLHEALEAAGPSPRIVVDGPLRPLAIRGNPTGFSVLMPVRAVERDAT